MVVEERGAQVVCRGDGVQVAREVDVDVFHGQDLAVAATGRAAFEPEHRTQRWLAYGRRRAHADPVETLGQSDRRRGFALAERRGRDRGDDDSAAVGPIGHASQSRRLDLRLVGAVQVELLVEQAQVMRDFDDGPELGGASDLEARFHLVQETRRLRPRPAMIGWPVCCQRAARTRCSSRTAFVTGPTPPGTGVIAAATLSADSKSTSPTMRSPTTLMPMSTTSAPG